MTWTHFHDMHSGGGQKLAWGHIFIEAPQKEAEVVFQNRFKRNPNRVTCTCCGPDYSISEEPTLLQVTAFYRGCEYVYRRPDGSECDEREGFVSGKGIQDGYKGGYEERPAKRFRMHEYMTLEDYIASGKAHFIYASNINPEERNGSLRAEGYVWAGDDE
jgi:hypothetical protein